MDQDTAASTGKPAAGDSAPADDGFVVESASVPMEPSPADTTASAPPAEEPGTDADDAAAAAAATDDASDDELSASQSAPAVKGKPAKAAPAKPGQKGKPTLQARVEQVRSELGRETYKLRETQRQIAEAERRLKELTGTAPAASATGKAPTGAPSATKPSASDGDPGPMPEIPSYRDFDTDAAYEEAVKKWREELTAWNTARDAALEARITSKVDGRLNETNERAAREASTRASQAVISRAMQKYGEQDWKEKANGLTGIRSSWYDAEKHGDIEAPFLSDLASSLLTSGKDDGADLLYFLGSDPARAQALADLLPSRPLRDALVKAPDGALIPMLEHFATDEGAAEFDELARMQPIDCLIAIGALASRLSSASSGTDGRPKPITSATLPAQPPGGATPERPGRKTASNPKGVPFDVWMEQEDAREQAQKRKALGLA